ncbi:MAG: CpsD/CapB family tyrosine-protein kinase [Candidatus Krumholzibacteria bacterium]|nr:CpsD/CapB family tyrosine-protein kinase [Candidatus Krumholzibacteria bacterium]
MSKIFDALRKAETAKKTGSGKVLRPKPAKRVSSRGETSFMKGLDKDFRRSLLNLRNAIDSEIKNRDSRVVMFTSAVGGEGKTMISAYLARVLALGEVDRVLIIDCAVNNPQLHDLFGVSNEKGILDLLSGEAELSEVITVLDEGVMDIITIGTTRSADITQPLFNSERMKSFINAVAEHYDYVLIDTSAILEAPETPIIGALSTGIVIVVEAGRTKREVIKRAMTMIEKLDGEFIGSVLNKKKYYIPEFIYRRV